MSYRDIKKEMGISFNKAMDWYKTIHNIDSDVKLPEWNLLNMKREWGIFSHLRDMVVVNEEGASGVSLEAKYVDSTYKVCRSIFAKDYDPNLNIPDEDKLDYINQCIASFKLQTESETLHKETLPILKFSTDNIEFNEDGVAYFDSSQASSFIGGDIHDNKKGMRWVASSENGISRVLNNLGLSNVVVFMGDDSVPVEVKAVIFDHGLTDRATGKHYMCSAPSASSTRNATFPYVEADTRTDIYDIWCLVTGFKNMKYLLEGLGSKVDVTDEVDPNSIPEFMDNNDIVDVVVEWKGKPTTAHAFKENGVVSVYVVNIAKLKARLAMDGSASFPIFELTESERILSILKHPNVDYTKDAVGTVSVPYKYISAPGVLTMKDGDSVEV